MVLLKSDRPQLLVNTILYLKLQAMNDRKSSPNFDLLAATMKKDEFLTQAYHTIDKAIKQLAMKDL